VVGYFVTVPGIGSAPVAVREISGRLPAGTYAIEVQAVGACGVGPAAAVILTVP
jgi:hypothetical protein